MRTMRRLSALIAALLFMTASGARAAPNPPPPITKLSQWKHKPFFDPAVRKAVVVVEHAPGPKPHYLALGISVDQKKLVFYIVLESVAELAELSAKFAAEAARAQATRPHDCQAKDVRTLVLGTDPRIDIGPIPPPPAPDELLKYAQAITALPPPVFNGAKGLPQ